MPEGELHVVTGAFGYSGKSIARRLLDEGRRVRTLTNSVGRANPFAARIEVSPYHFDDVPKLDDALRGAAVLYNTDWARQNAARLGRRYANELARRRHRRTAYENL